MKRREFFGKLLAFPVAVAGVFALKDKVHFLVPPQTQGKFMYGKVVITAPLLKTLSKGAFMRSMEAELMRMRADFLRSYDEFHGA